MINKKRMYLKVMKRKILIKAYFHFDHVINLYKNELKVKHCMCAIFVMMAKKYLKMFRDI